MLSCFQVRDDRNRECDKILDDARRQKSMLNIEMKKLLATLTTAVLSERNKIRLEWVSLGEKLDKLELETERKVAEINNLFTKITAARKKILVAKCSAKNKQRNEQRGTPCGALKKAYDISSAHQAGLNMECDSDKDSARAKTGEENEKKDESSLVEGSDDDKDEELSTSEDDDESDEKSTTSDTAEETTETTDGHSNCKLQMDRDEDLSKEHHNQPGNNKNARNTTGSFVDSMKAIQLLLHTHT